ncbi:unnamed protein product [Dovyalis caffra]|uniref:Uncharacterized protein n=1 Tax=Dovyalis caffra TaxID=77055 RepID=A0AAV1SDK1_9ROSI|nr:unnamed protein product [Dovyalis caffra]
MAVDILPEKLPAFTNMRKLAVASAKGRLESLVPFTILLKAAPFLTEFGFSDCEIGPAMSKATCSSYPRRHLKEVKMSGFYGHAITIELDVAVCLLRTAFFLEKMELNTKQKYYVGDGNTIREGK